MKRRTRLNIKLTATAVVIASAVLARQLSDDDVATFGIVQAALFLAFGVSSIVLFAVVVTDFDQWTETVPPVPKRVVRRFIARATRRVRRAGAWALAAFGAAMTWFWSRVGAVLGTVTARSAHGFARFWLWVARAEGAVLANVGAGLTVFWIWTVRGGVRALIVYRAVMQPLWTAVGRALAWTVVRSGKSLTVAWAWAVRGGVRVLVGYRAVMQPLWMAVGRAFAWTVVRSGEGLTVAWAWAVRGGVRALVWYGAAMQWIWTGVGRAVVWTLRRCRSGLERAWLAVAGRGDEPTPKPIRRWYTATVDSAFGIPPDGTSVDVFGGRVAPADRESRESETVGAPAPRTPKGTDHDPVL